MSSGRDAESHGTSAARRVDVTVIAGEFVGRTGHARIHVPHAFMGDYSTVWLDGETERCLVFPDELRSRWIDPRDIQWPPDEPVSFLVAEGGGVAVSDLEGRTKCLAPSDTRPNTNTGEQNGR
jgi:hypothetical protein